MKRSKLIVSIVLVVMLFSMIVMGLMACDVNKKPSNPTDDGEEGTVTPPEEDDPPIIIPPTPDLPEDDPGNNPGNDPGNNSGGDGTVTPPKDPTTPKDRVRKTKMNALPLIAKLMEGTQVNVEDKQYRIVNLYIDISTVDMKTGLLTKERFIFRTNIDKDGMANDFAVQLVDLTDLVDQVLPGDGEGENIVIADDESGVGATIGLSVSAQKLEEDIAYESQGKILWGFYAVGNKMFMDVGADRPLLYFEDFDMDYMKQIMFAAKDIIQDGKYDGLLQGEVFQLINNLLKGDKEKGMTIDDILGLVSVLIFGTGNVTTTTKAVTGDVIVEYDCEIKLNDFIKKINDIKGLIGLLIDLPFDLNLGPLAEFLTDWVPKMDLRIVGKTFNGVTEEFAVVATRKDITDTKDPLYNQEIMGFRINTDRCYSEVKHDIGIPQRVYENLDYEPFSLTNIALSLDIVLDTGEPVDLGAIINSFVAKELLPEGVIILDVQTGLRLDLALDLDLNYGKDSYIDEQGQSRLVDRNLVMLELYLIDVNGNYVDVEPLIGAYYKEGALYANVDHLLDRYYAGNNIKINIDGIPDVVQYIINLVTNALDGVFKNTLGLADWVNWADLRQSRFDYMANQQNPATPETPAPEEGANEELATASVDDLKFDTQIDCVALAHNEYGDYVVSTNFVSFLKGIGSVVGFGDIFGWEYDPVNKSSALTITANEVFWNALNALAKIQGFTWPGGLYAKIALNFDKEGTMTHISIDALVDPRGGFVVGEGEEATWYIGNKASLKPLIYANDEDGLFTDVALTNEFILPETETIDNYSIVYPALVGATLKFYLDKEKTNEVIIGKNSQGQTFAYKTDAINTGVKASQIVASSSNAKISAFVYSVEQPDESYAERWVIGYGHDEGEFIPTDIAVQGIYAGISLHSIMLCYGSQYLKRFDPAEGGTSYKGYYGAKTNLEGYILYRTHKMVKAEGLSDKSTGTYYLYNNLDKTYTLVELGEGKEVYNAANSYFSLVEKGYVDSVSKFLTSILSGTYLSLNLNVSFSAGKYNLAPLIGLFLDSMADKQLLWEFTDAFEMDISLNIGIALDKNNPENSKLVVEIVTNDKDIVIGNQVLFAKNSTILGIYGVGNNVYIEISNLRLLNIKIPDLYFQLDYTTLIYTLLGEKEILDLSFNLGDLIAPKPDAQNQVASGELAQAPLDTSNSLTATIDSQVVAVSVSIAAVQSLLGAFGVDLGAIDLTKIMDLAVDLVLNRTEGITLDINGALLPKYTPERGNYFDEDLHIGLQMGTDKAPVQIGDTSALMASYEGKFQTLAESTAQYHENIIDAITTLIGGIGLEIRIDAETLQSVWDINKIVDTIVADQADKFALPLQVNFDDWKTDFVIKLQLYLDLNNFKNTQILVELQYEGNVWIGLYIIQNSIVIDLNGLGLFDFELANSTIVAKAGNLLSSLLGSLGDLSLTTLLNGLIDDLLAPKPQEETAGEEVIEGEVAQADPQAQEPATSDEPAQAPEADPAAETSVSNDLIAMLLGSISATNTAVTLSLTKNVFSQIFRELLGFDLFLALELALDIDILAGTITAGLNVEEMVYGDITISLDAGRPQEEYKFDDKINLDDIPNWNAINGEFMVRSLLKNLEIGLYIDLNQYTSTTGQPMYTRIYIEKLTSRRTLPKTGGTIAAKDSILVTLAGIDEAEFNNANTGKKDIWLFAELNWQDGKLYLNICEGFLNLKILGGIGVDVGNVMGRLAIDLDLVSMLSGTIDNLLLSLEGMLDGLATSKDAEDVGEVIEDTTTSIVQANTTQGVIKAAEIHSAGDLERKTTLDNVGKYIYYGNEYYVVEESDGTAVRRKLTVDTTTYSGTTQTFNDLPDPSSITPENEADYINKIYKTDYYFDEVNMTEATYNYYICLPLTRRTYGYYKVEIVSGLSALFSDLDILGLFDMVTLSLTSTGILNADIVVDEYMINYVIDNLMYYIFGPETILDLQKMTEGSSMSFSKNYLAEVYWNRVEGGKFFDSLWVVVQPLLGDVLKGLINIDLSFLMGAISNLKSTLQNIINRLLPFAVSNETHLGLNLVRGQLTNIYLTLLDHNTAIVDDNNQPYTFHNGSKLLTYTANSRQAGYFTELHIFNTSPSVGNQDYTGVDGAIMWDGVPSSIVYDPYAYPDEATAYNEIYNTYFVDKEATYQKGQSLYKADLSFTVESYTNESGQVISKNNAPLTSDYASSPIKFDQPGVYKVIATAPFNGGNTTKTLEIAFTVRSEAPIKSIASLEMSVYQQFPAYLVMTTTDNVVRRFSTDTLSFYTKHINKDGELVSDGKIRHEFGYVNPDPMSDGGWDETVYVGFPGGQEGEMVIHYYNSTIDNVIIAGSENNVIEIDLYQFDTKTPEGTTTKLENYTPNTLFFYYPNKIAASLPVDEWDYGTANQLFDRLAPGYNPEELRKPAQYTIKATVCKGDPDKEQIVEITFNVKSKEVSSVSFGDKINTLDIQPYEYYLYLSDKTTYEKYNPYSDVVTVNYDVYSDQVHVVWDDTAIATDYSWNVSNNTAFNRIVRLDSEAYPSGDLFGWEKEVRVIVARNQIEGVYFDKALTKSSLSIDPYVYNNLNNKHSYYPTSAFVKFTNGKVIEMPIAWNWNEIDNYIVNYHEDYTQFTLSIGYDIPTYTTTGEIVPFTIADNSSTFLQNFKVNVHVDSKAITDILLEGTDFVGGSYRVDPVAVNYQNAPVFPNTVSIRYENGQLGTIAVKRWEYDESTITMSGGMNYTAKGYITDNLSFDLHYEVLDRSADKMIVDTSLIEEEAINPYRYIVQEDGSITYDVFSNFLTVSYVTSYTLKLITTDVLRSVEYSENATTLDDVTNAKKRLRTKYNYVTTTQTYTVNGKECKLTIQENYTNYDLPVKWDTGRLNLSMEGGIETVYFYFGYGTAHQIEKDVEVEFLTKQVDHVGGEGYAFLLGKEAANLSPEEQRSGKPIRRLEVFFTDGTSEYVDCLVDLTTLRTTTKYYGFGAGKGNLTRFDYNPAEVTSTTAGTFYVQGMYIETQLRASNYDPATTYYSFVVADVNASSTGEYYVNHNGNFLKVNLGGEGGAMFNSSTVYYTREVITDAPVGTTTITAYIYNAEEMATVELTGQNILYNSSTQYFNLTISNEMYAEVQVAYGSGSLVQKTQVKVYVLNM